MTFFELIWNFFKKSKLLKPANSWDYRNFQLLRHGNANDFFLFLKLSASIFTAFSWLYFAHFFNFTQFGTFLELNQQKKQVDQTCLFCVNHELN